MSVAFGLSVADENGCVLYAPAKEEKHSYDVIISLLMASCRQDRVCCVGRDWSGPILAKWPVGGPMVEDSGL